jgi:two-component system sensor histidine kinase KdpD
MMERMHTVRPHNSVTDIVRDAVRALRIWSPADRIHALVAFGAVAIATVAMLPWRESLGILNVSLIFLLIVFVVALRAGSRAATLSALMSFALFDFFFIPPYHTFTIASRDHVLALFVYVGVAVATGRLVSHLQGRTEQAERAEARATLLAELNSALIGGVTLHSILSAIVERVVKLIDAASAQILVPNEDGSFSPRASFPERAPLDRQDFAVASWVFENRQPSGRRAIAGTPFGRWRKAGDTRSRALLMLPIATTDRAIGVLAIEQAEGAAPISPDAELVLVTFAAQAALAIDRTRLTEEAARSAALAQSDELKSALLAAVSHDLRTPLATIKASTTSLLDTSVPWDENAKREFLIGIDEETDRLTLMVSNLLDLSRIEGGALKPDFDWVDGSELLNDVARRLRGRASATGKTLTVDVPHELPLLWLDYVEIAEVLLNLGDNSLKYSPEGSTIRFSLEISGSFARFAVEDNGPGMSKRDRNRVFTKFVRGDTAGKSIGAGIGLSISKGLVEAHGGKIWLESEVGRGTTVFFTIPLVKSDMTLDAGE